MRVPLGWLREYVDLPFDAHQLAAQLTTLGMEVKAVERWGSDWQDVVVGELLTVEKHPRADRLFVTRVDVGQGAPLEIVSGATNIAPGQRVPVALPGAVLPGGRKIEVAEKLGVASQGMLCSGDELRLTGDADGILILEPTAPVGVPLVDLLGDWVLDVDVKPNRGDALSLVGLAREVAALTGGEIRFPPTEVDEEDDPVEAHLVVRVEEPTLCPRFVGRWVRGVHVGPSPDWVQMRLLAAGMRPVSNVVDASNYVMLELGKPIHTFDGGRVGGDDAGRAVIVVRRAREGEVLETLDHVQRRLDPETLVIADPAGPLGIAGVMGGANSEVGEGTEVVVVESAIFDPVSIRRTAQRYGLRSEASLRFEKGQEVRLARLGADRTARLIQAWAGGRVARGRIDTAPNEPAPARVAFRPARINRLLGTALSAETQAGLLGRVGIRCQVATEPTEVVVAEVPERTTVVAPGHEVLVASVPTWRRDLAIEADIAEEVARLYGYEAIPGRLPPGPPPPFRPSPLGVRDAVRRLLAGAGLDEVVTFALVSPEMAAAHPAPVGIPAAAGEGAAEGVPIRVTNPLSSQHSVLRQSLLGSLVEVVRLNRRRGRDRVAVFEVGKGYGRRPDGTVTEWWRVGIALAGPASPPHWAVPPRPMDYYDASGIVALLCRGLALGAPTFAPLTDDPVFHPGRAARVSATNGRGELALSGRLGELHPERLEPEELREGRIVVAELSIAGLAAGVPEPVQAAAPPRRPAVQRDLAVVVAEGTAAAAVEEVIRRRAGSLLRDLSLFDVYRGAPLADGEKSLAFRLVLQDPERTLTDEEVDRLLEETVADLAAVGGRLRG